MVDLAVMHMTLRIALHIVSMLGDIPRQPITW